MKTVAARLRNARLAQGWTQAELAQKLAVSRSAVAQWESHSGSLPSTASFTSLTATLNCRFEWLATGRGIRELSSEPLDEDSAGIAVDLRYFARDDAEEQLIVAFRALDEYDQSLVSDLVSAMQRKPRSRRREVV